VTTRGPAARARVRRRLDFARIADAIARPGIDPRPWVAEARVDDDDDAIVWDAEIGWLVDVTLTTGEHAGEGPVVCRVASPAQGAGVTMARPPRRDSRVLVVFPDGDPNTDAVVVGQLHDAEEFGAPSEVNGDNITEDLALETWITVAPDENLDEQWRNVRITVADDGGAMVLGAAEADQAFARGNDLADALDDFAAAVGDFAQSLAASTPAPPNGALTVADAIAAAAPLIAAAEAFQASRAQYLSTRIVGD